MHVHKHMLYFLEQHSDSFKYWSEIITINTEGKSLIRKLGIGGQNTKCAVGLTFW